MSGSDRPLGRRLHRLGSATAVPAGKWGNHAALTLATALRFPVLSRACQEAGSGAPGWAPRGFAPRGRRQRVVGIVGTSTARLGWIARKDGFSNCSAKLDRHLNIGTTAANASPHARVAQAGAACVDGHDTTDRTRRLRRTMATTRRRARAEPRRPSHRTRTKEPPGQSLRCRRPRPSPRSDGAVLGRVRTARRRRPGLGPGFVAPEHRTGVSLVHSHRARARGDRTCRAHGRRRLDAHRTLRALRPRIACGACNDGRGTARERSRGSARGRRAHLRSGASVVGRRSLTP